MSQPPRPFLSLPRRFSQWPVDALEAVAAKFLADLDVTPQQRRAVSDACRSFHEDVHKLSEQYRCASPSSCLRPQQHRPCARQAAPV